MKKITFLFSVMTFVQYTCAMWGSAIEHKQEIPYLGRPPIQSNRLARYFPVEEEKKEQVNLSAEHKVDNTDDIENSRELASNIELVVGYNFLHECEESCLVCQSIKAQFRDNDKQCDVKTADDQSEDAIKVEDFLDEKYFKSSE
jgi:hypothetical protein